MIISAPVNLFSAKNHFVTHYRLSAMSRAYRFIWQPRFGWRRAYITNPLMRYFLRWRNRPSTGNYYYLRFLHHLGPVDVTLASKDLQFCPPPKGFEYGSEPDLQVLLQALSRDIVAFYDVGANFGFFSLLLTSMASFQGKIYAFEPTPGTYANFKILADAVDVEKRIEAVEAAVSDHAGKVHMSLPVETHSGYATLGSGQNAGAYEVSAITLDEWKSSGGKLGPDFMKIDVEGHEMQALKGSTGIIESYRPFIYFENGHTLPASEHDEIFAFFKNRNYALYIPTWMYVDHDLWRTCRLPVAGFANHLTLIDIREHPELLHDRSLLMVLNIVACPVEKIPLLRERLHSLQAI